MLYAEPACARFPLRARSLSPQRHRVATRLLNVGLGFFLVILHAAYTANLAAFLGDREVGDYWESIEDATSAGAKICAHLILQPTLEAQYPHTNFHYRYMDSAADLREAVQVDGCNAFIMSQRSMTVGVTVDQARCELGFVATAGIGNATVGTFFVTSALHLCPS